MSFAPSCLELKKRKREWEERERGRGDDRKVRSRREEERVSDRGGGTQKEGRTQKISEDKINGFRMRGELERAESTVTNIIKPHNY